jgi:NAD(P)-dependent dehydrogenase (short-subunit alcohol dehydrogenase family)
MFDLTGKVAIITGSSRGIGKSIAEQMAFYGAKVVISSRKADACDNVVEEINENLKDRSGEAVAIPCNISHKSELQNIVDQTISHFGKIDILVCNAALSIHYGSLSGISDDAFDKMMNCNIKSNHWLCHMVLPGMVEREDGVIIIVSSIGGLQGSAELGMYGMTKAADMALVRNLAVEYGPKNIRVNAIAPGLIRTDFSRAFLEDKEKLGKRLANTPLRRIGEPDEVAGLAVYLASKAGGFTTGQTFIIDGGVTC